MTPSSTPPSPTPSTPPAAPGGAPGVAPDVDPGPVRTPGWRIGSLRGVPVYLGRSWPVIALVVVLAFAPTIRTAIPGLGVGAYLVGIVYAVLLLVSVLAHEAGHALVAQRLGHRVERIVADLWGGHTTYQATSNSPARSALVAVAGPAMNGLLALVAWLLLPHMATPVTWLLMGAVLYSNAFVALFNLLPGLPLDGGFLVDSLVWKATGSRTRGQLVAGWTGRVVAIGVVAWFVGLPLLRGDAPGLWSIAWMALIASFLWQGASAAITGAHLQTKVDAVDVRTVIRPVVLVPSDAPVAALHQATPGAVAVVAGPDGRPLGFVGDAVEQLPVDRHATTPLSAVTVALPPGAVIDWRDGLTSTDVLTVMAHSDSPVVLVHDGAGRYGLVSAADIDARITAG